MTRSLRHFRVLLVVLLLLASGAGNAIGLPILGSSQAQESQKTQKLSPKQLESSLDSIISTLQDDKKRSQLLKQLEDLKAGLAAGTASAQSSQASESGLLGALSSSIGSLGKKAEGSGSPLAIWGIHFRSAMASLRAMVYQTPRAKLIGNITETLFGLAAWLFVVMALTLAGRRGFEYRGWPTVLPPEPRPWLLVAHFTRRITPTLLTFLILLAFLRMIGISVAAGTTILVIAYVALCGQLLSTIFDVVISLFTRGHRRVAVAILHNVALNRLFAIGALIALGDAVNDSRVSFLLGSELTYDLSILSNSLAAIISAALVLRIRRPVTHLISNRPLKRRRQRSSYQEIVVGLAHLWHIPALLLIIISISAMFISAGQTHAALGRAIICAVLLVLALLASGLLRRGYEHKGNRRRTHRNDHIVRLRQVGFTLAHVLAWAIFAELCGWVWGISVFGFGHKSLASGHVGHSLINLGLTIIISWVAWILLDRAIYRALQGRHRNTNRAQTIMPMIRNITLFTIITIGVIASLSSLGVDVTPLLAGAGIIGIALGFGAQHLVSDLITGIFILIEDSLTVGDFVEINGYMGTVESLNMRAVWLRDIDGVVHITTFSRITGIHNMSRQFGIALMKLRIPHDLLIDDAIELMHKTAADLQKDPYMRGLVRSHLEIQGIHEFDQGCPILRMRLRTKPEYQWEVSRAFNLALKRRMEAEHISLGAPRISMSMEAGGGTRYGKSGQVTEDRATTMDWPVDEAKPAEAN